MSRRRFGAVRKLPSGRWQVRYRHPTTDRYQTAPGTFGTKTEAGRWLAMLEADMLRGDWLDPARGDMCFGEVAERWMATKVHLRNGRLSFSAPKTCAGVRTIALPQFIVDVVVNHLDHWSAPGPDGLVFVMPEGTPLRRENFRQRVWLPSCRAAGVNDLRFHDLRHTGATLAAASGAPLRALMHRLGHASAAAAIRYQHRVAGQDEAIANYLDGIGRAALPPPTAEVTRLSR